MSIGTIMIDMAPSDPPNTTLDIPGVAMTGGDPRSSSSRSIKRSVQSLFISLVVLLFASVMVCGCIVEESGHEHGGWWYHHPEER
jgi:hypothetical protein